MKKISHKPLLSRPKAERISLAVFLLGLAVISYTDSWWPEIAVVLAVSLGVRNVLLKKFYEAFLSIIVFGGIFVASKYSDSVSWISALFLIAGVALLFQAFLNIAPNEEDDELETQKELEEDTKP